MLGRTVQRRALAAVLLATAVVASPAIAQTVAPAPIVQSRHHHTHGDPVEGVNRGLFSVHQLLDRIFFRPVAMIYKTVVPKFARTGIRHVISNLTEPVVFLNDVLQLKPKRAVRTFGRFAINSTLGIGGIVDVAKAEKLPHRNNGFGNTLGRYGVGPGPYLFIPLVGPTDLRDLIGGQADGAVLPLAVGDPFNRTAFIVPTLALGGLDLRAESDGELKALLGGAADPYATLRSVYLQSRAADIAEVRHDQGGGALDDPLVDPEAGPKAAGEDGAMPATPRTQPDVFDTTPADPEPTPLAKP